MKSAELNPNEPGEFKEAGIVVSLRIPPADLWRLDEYRERMGGISRGDAVMLLLDLADEA